MNIASFSVTVEKRWVYWPALKLIAALAFAGLISVERAGKWIARYCYKLRVSGSIEA